MKLLIHVGTNTSIPPFYGVCYTYDHIEGALCAPVPINIVIGLYDRLRCFLKWGWRRQRLSLSQSYDNGYRAGVVDSSSERRTVEIKKTNILHRWEREYSHGSHPEGCICLSCQTRSVLDEEVRVSMPGRRKGE